MRGNCSCRREGGKIRQKKLTKFTADALTVATKSSIAAATYMLAHHHFEFVLPTVFSQDPLEKFFGQARQRHGGNIYIDVGDHISAGRAQSLHQMLKYNVIPQGCEEWKCSYCTAPIILQDVDLMQETCIEDTQLLLDSTDALKHKVVFIAGFLAYIHGKPGEGEEVSSELLQELDRGGLRLSTLNTTCFVHMAINLLDKLPEPKNRCIYNEILSFVDAPLARSWVASCTLANTLLKAQVIHTTDREQQYGCLRRKEKLQENIN